jgi:hypothetical protein
MSVTVVYRSAADLNRAEYWYREGPKLQIEVEKLRKVVEAARGLFLGEGEHLCSEFEDAIDRLEQALAELDKEGER